MWMQLPLSGKLYLLNLAPTHFVHGFPHAFMWLWQALCEARCAGVALQLGGSCPAWPLAALPSDSVAWFSDGVGALDLMILRVFCNINDFAILQSDNSGTGKSEHDGCKCPLHIWSSASDLSFLQTTEWLTLEFKAVGDAFMRHLF